MIPKNNDMRFEVSTVCNYDCIICPRGQLCRKQEIMSFDLFKFIFDQIILETNQYDTLSFPGMGEPLMDKTLLDKIKYAKTKNKKLNVLILTNGAFLTPKLFKELEDAGIISIRVSFYGYDNDTYDGVHRPMRKKMYAQIKDNLVKICEIKKTTELLMTYNVVTGVNDEKINEWIDFWKEKADLLEVWRPHNWVDAKAYRAVQKNQMKTCNRPLTGPLQVQVDGTINMCCFDFNGKLTLGDLKIQSLNDIFSSNLYKKIVQCHKSGDFNDSGLICEFCDQRNCDKKDVMVYNSKFKIEDRVYQVSTTYKSL